MSRLRRAVRDSWRAAGDGIEVLLDHRRLVAWFLLAVAAYIAAEVSATAGAAPWDGFAGALRLGSLVFALVAAALELRRSYERAEQRLRQSRARVRALLAEVRKTRSFEEERSHEARSALAAIEYAMWALGSQEMPATVRAQLRAAVEAEVTLLRRLLSRPDRSEQPGPFFVLDAVLSPVTVTRLAGVRVDMHIPPDLAAVGGRDSVTQVVQCLLDNARRHAPGSPIRVRAARRDDTCLLTVQDRGPGVAADRRIAIFERGWSAETSGDGAGDGTGLGLYISAETVRRLGGDLWVEDRPGGGASFVISLPATDTTVARTAQAS